MCALPSGKQASTIQAMEEGNYQARLKAITLQVDSEFDTKEKYNDGDGLCFQGGTMVWDVDGEEFQDRYIRISTNERAKFFNRLSALIGRDINDTDVLEWKINKKAETKIALDQYYKASKDDPATGVKKGQWVITDDEPLYEGIEGLVDDLLVNGESLLGRECLLQIGKNKNGYNIADSSAAAALPKRASRRTTNAANEEAEAEAAPARGRRAAPAQEPEETEDETEEAPAAPPARGRRQAPAGAPV